MKMNNYTDVHVGILTLTGETGQDVNLEDVSPFYWELCNTLFNKIKIDIDL